MAHSPLAPLGVAKSPMKDIQVVDLSNQYAKHSFEATQEAVIKSGKETAMSPLRSRSRSQPRSNTEQSMPPGTVHYSQLPPPSQIGRIPVRSGSSSRESPYRVATFEDNQEKMRVSQERIASILGLDKHSLQRPIGPPPVRPPPHMVGPLDPAMGSPYQPEL